MYYYILHLYIPIYKNNSGICQKSGGPENQNIFAFSNTPLLLEQYQLWMTGITADPIWTGQLIIIIVN